MTPNEILRACNTINHSATEAATNKHARKDFKDELLAFCLQIEENYAIGRDTPPETLTAEFLGTVLATLSAISTIAALPEINCELSCLEEIMLISRFENAGRWNEQHLATHQQRYTSISIRHLYKNLTQLHASVDQHNKKYITDELQEYCEHIQCLYAENHSDSNPLLPEYSPKLSVIMSKLADSTAEKEMGIAHRAISHTLLAIYENSTRINSNIKPVFLNNISPAEYVQVLRTRIAGLDEHDAERVNIYHTTTPSSSPSDTDIAAYITDYCKLTTIPCDFIFPHMDELSHRGEALATLARDHALPAAAMQCDKALYQMQSKAQQWGITEINGQSIIETNKGLLARIKLNKEDSQIDSLLSDMHRPTENQKSTLPDRIKHLYETIEKYCDTNFTGKLPQEKITLLLKQFHQSAHALYTQIEQLDDSSKQVLRDNADTILLHLATANRCPNTPPDISTEFAYGDTTYFIMEQAKKHCAATSEHFKHVTEAQIESQQAYLDCIRILNPSSAANSNSSSVPIPIFTSQEEVISRNLNDVAQRAAAPLTSGISTLRNEVNHFISKPLPTTPNEEMALAAQIVLSYQKIRHDYTQQATPPEESLSKHPQAVITLLNDVNHYIARQHNIELTVRHADMVDYITSQAKLGTDRTVEQHNIETLRLFIDRNSTNSPTIIVKAQEERFKDYYKNITVYCNNKPSHKHFLAHANGIVVKLNNIITAAWNNSHSLTSLKLSSETMLHFLTLASKHQATDTHLPSLKKIYTTGSPLEKLRQNYQKRHSMLQEACIIETLSDEATRKKFSITAYCASITKLYNEALATPSIPPVILQMLEPKIAATLAGFEKTPQTTATRNAIAQARAAMNGKTVPVPAPARAQETPATAPVAPPAGNKKQLKKLHAEITDISKHSERLHHSFASSPENLADIQVICSRIKLLYTDPKPDFLSKLQATADTLLNHLELLAKDAANHFAIETRACCYDTMQLLAPYSQTAGQNAGTIYHQYSQALRSIPLTSPADTITAYGDALTRKSVDEIKENDALALWVLSGFINYSREHGLLALHASSVKTMSDVLVRIEAHSPDMQLQHSPSTTEPAPSLADTVDSFKALSDITSKMVEIDQFGTQATAQPTTSKVRKYCDTIRSFLSTQLTVPITRKVNNETWTNNVAYTVDNSPIKELVPTLVARLSTIADNAEITPVARRALNTLLFVSNAASLPTETVQNRLDKLPPPEPAANHTPSQQPEPVALTPPLADRPVTPPLQASSPDDDDTVMLNKGIHASLMQPSLDAIIKKNLSQQSATPQQVDSRPTSPQELAPMIRIPLPSRQSIASSKTIPQPPPLQATTVTEEAIPLPPVSKLSHMATVFIPTLSSTPSIQEDTGTSWAKKEEKKPSRMKKLQQQKQHLEQQNMFQNAELQRKAHEVAYLRQQLAMMHPAPQITPPMMQQHAMYSPPPPQLPLQPPTPLQALTLQMSQPRLQQR